VSEQKLLILSGWAQPDKKTGLFFSRLKVIDVSCFEALVNGRQDYNLPDPDIKNDFDIGSKSKEGTQFYNWKYACGIYDCVVLTQIKRDFNLGINRASFFIQSYEKSLITIEDWFAFLHGGVVEKTDKNGVKTNGVGSGVVPKGFNVAA
jgi:hypothetical protein